MKDQDLRTALDPGKIAFNAYWETPNARWDEMSDLGKAKWAQAEAKIVAAYLTPAQAPDKAGEREGAEDDARDAQYKAEQAEEAECDALFRAETAEAEITRLQAIIAALASQLNGTEASRGAGGKNWKLAAELSRPLSEWDAATPTPPLSPDSTGPAGALAECLQDAIDDLKTIRDLATKKVFVCTERYEAAVAAALTPSAPIAAPVREPITDDGEVL